MTMTTEPDAALRVTALLPIPDGLEFGGFEAHDGAKLWLVDMPGVTASVTFELAPMGDPSAAREMVSEERDCGGADVWRSGSSPTSPKVIYSFAGGCVTYKFGWSQPRPASVTDGVIAEVDFVTRERVADALAESTDDRLKLDPEVSNG